MGYYDSISKGYDALHKEEQLNKLRLIKENLSIKKIDRLLDVGCGTGFSLDFFDCECIGIEPEPNMAGKSPKIVLGKAENLPFSENAFDVVICVTAIHNFSDIKKGLLEMKRVGKEKFAFSVLKKSRNFFLIKELIHSLFDVKNEIDEKHDMIFICAS